VPVAFLLRLHLVGGDPFFGPRFLGYAANSLILAGAATLLVMVIAFVLGAAQRSSPHGPFSWLVRFSTLGYALPGTVIAVGVLVPLALFDNSLDAFARAAFGISTGLLLSGTVIALLFAYVVRFLAVGHGAVESGFERIDRRFDDVARTLGRGESGVHRDVHVPLLRRPLLAGALVVFVDVLKELPATLIVRPFDFDTLAVRVYQLASDERLAQASTGALMIVLIGLVPVIVLTRVIRETSVQAASPRASGGA
jgi:iron(III) transport system permease protein